MGHDLFSFLLLFLVVGADHASSQVHYYITPSLSVQCPADHCLTLAGFVANFSGYIGNETNISLSFLSGNHSLNGELYLSHANNFTMTKNTGGDGIVFVECCSQSGRFNISQTTLAVIRDLHFIGCGDNEVSQVEQFIVEDTIFEGVEGRGTALALNEVTDAAIVRSSFLSNTHSSIFENYNTTDLATVLASAVYPLSMGGALFTISSDVVIIDSNFMDNTAEIGGALFAYNSSLQVVSSTYSHNRASFGGVMVTALSPFDIENSTFSENRAQVTGGVMVSFLDSFGISNTTFSTNSAGNLSGVMATFESKVKIHSSIFTNSSAAWTGVIFTLNSSCDIISSTFANNSAGVMTVMSSSFTITKSIFSNNSAAQRGSVIFGGGSTFYVIGSSYRDNKVNIYYGTIYTVECILSITSGIFHHNLGSIYILSGILILHGHTKIESCEEPSNTKSRVGEEGGAITSYDSTVMFYGVSSLSNNQARRGGAILATESEIIMFGDSETTIANNTATDTGGGGIYLQQSEVNIYGNCTISGNDAMRGGGICATSSTIAVHQPSLTDYQPRTLQFINNRAVNGSGLYLEVNTKLYVLTPLKSHSSEISLMFIDNHAHYGGAIYVADDTYSGTCSPDNECFVQSLALDPEIIKQFERSKWNILFFANTASEKGANLFGGLLDRCIPSPFAEVYLPVKPLHYSGVSYFSNISNLTAIDTISSLPVRVFFCKSESEPDGSYQPPTFKVKKGEALTVPLVAVDQVNHSVDANIISSLSSQDGGFSEGQQTQSVGKYCSNVTFNVFSPHNSETINLYADGPCGTSILSTRQLHIEFTACTCPVGFEPVDSDTRCECDCDSKLSAHITHCNSTTESLVRMNTNSWITHVNDSHIAGYIIHSNCPLDYCRPPTESVSMNLNHPDGSDAQCAYNRSGVLCGACQQQLSLSLGSSRCLSCDSHWPIVLVVILLAAIVAGILLVTALLALNMTVAVGLINGFVFYANIASANSAIFFPSSEPSFPTVFVAWLNLDIGIDTCFFNGLDAYTKTWLQVAFPVYIISLVTIIIIVSEYSPRFARLIGKRDPVATLATLTQLSYAKLLSVTITALSFAVLDYPDGSQRTVWLPDGNVPYFQGKHVALVLVALLIILVGVPYTVLLLLWQWLVRAPKWKVFNWTRNTKLNAFVSVHHAPYNSKYRYWTGLLLLVRVVLYVTAAVTVSGVPQTSLLLTSVLVGSLPILKELTGARVYKNSALNILETMLYFNLVALSAFSWYRFKNDIMKQTAVAYISTIITFILLVGVIICHAYWLAMVIKDRSRREEVNEYLLVPVQPATEVEVTHTVIEIPQPHGQTPPPGANSDQIEVKELLCTATPLYQ